MRRQRSPWPLMLASGIIAGALAISQFAPASASTQTNPEATQQYRPQVHFSPKNNWMNDPNGLVFSKGVYQLFYQYNPYGNTWGNMSWGHATSPDLVHWTEQPLAIPNDSQEDIFSGSVVADTANTSGFGTADNPPLVAVFTSAYTSGPNAGLQAQSLAYSVDDGQTWTKYAQNPVLNRNSSNFRDPKVFWYSGPAGSYWVMTAVEATQHQVVLYKSTDLKSWTHLSDFGPANATGGVWETPDLFPLKVDGDPQNVKWVLTVGINPGAVAGGSGGQYFVGTFDGTTFTSEDTVDTSKLPAGTTFEGFNGSTFDGWTATGTAFGNGPAAGAVDGQQQVTGFDGSGFANSFHGQDATTGTLTSPSFTIANDYLNFLVGGGNHPHVPGTQAGNDPPAGSELLFDGFEYPSGQSVTDNGWTLAGDFTPGLNPSTGGGTGYLGQKELNSFLGGPNGDGNQGTMTSPTFTIDKRYLSMLLSGGNRSAASGQTLQVELLVNGQVVDTAAGKNDGDLNWQSWDLAAYQGQQAQLRVDDQATGGWGSLAIDNVVLADTPAPPHGTETSVNLVVDGQVVRSATGTNAENLDWASWNVGDLVGKQASIQLVDDNTSGWGHINADQFMFSDTQQGTRLQQYNWVDWGRDFYAANSFNNIPNGERVMIGWMNNWDYGNDVATTPWRSAMSLPRDVELQTIDGQVRLVQHPVPQVGSIAETARAYTAATGPVAAGTTVLPAAANANVARVDVTLSQGSAQQFGVVVRRSADGSEGTPIVYDATTGKLSIDRRASGNVGFNPSFASVDSAPVTLANGKLHLEIYLDKSSVEVFAQGGARTITDQVFPADSSTGIALVAAGGTANVDSLTVTALQDAMWGASQTISFAPIADHTYGDSDFAVNASADSGLPVTLSASGACTVANGTVHLTGAGTCSITATQEGDALHNPAAPVTRHAIAKASQTISLGAIADRPLGSADVAVAASASTGLPVTLAATGGCSISGTVVHLVAIGQCVITATQAGNANYLPATATVSFAVLPPAWSSATSYTAGALVSYQGQVYKAAWSTKGEVPGSNTYGAWQQIVVAADGTAVWTPSRIFQAGDTVTYQGKVYRAAWYSRNDVPGSVTGPWQEIATAPDGTAVWTASRIFNAGDVVVYNGQKYVAKWYTRGQAPGGANSPWTLTH